MSEQKIFRLEREKDRDRERKKKSERDTDCKVFIGAQKINV